jgi:hypothetical protein
MNSFGIDKKIISLLSHGSELSAVRLHWQAYFRLMNSDAGGRWGDWTKFLFYRHWTTESFWIGKKYLILIALSKAAS